MAGILDKLRAFQGKRAKRKEEERLRVYRKGLYDLSVLLMSGQMLTPGPGQLQSVLTPDNLKIFSGFIRNFGEEIFLVLAGAFSLEMGVFSKGLFLIERKNGQNALSQPLPDGRTLLKTVLDCLESKHPPVRWTEYEWRALFSELMAMLIQSPARDIADEKGILPAAQAAMAVEKEHQNGRRELATIWEHLLSGKNLELEEAWSLDHPGEAFSYPATRHSNPAHLPVLVFALAGASTTWKNQPGISPRAIAVAEWAEATYPSLFLKNTLQGLAAESGGEIASKRRL